VSPVKWPPPGRHPLSLTVWCWLLKIFSFCLHVFPRQSCRAAFQRLCLIAGSIECASTHRPWTLANIHHQGVCDRMCCPQRPPPSLETLAPYPPHERRDQTLPTTTLTETVWRDPADSDGPRRRRQHLVTSCVRGRGKGITGAPAIPQTAIPIFLVLGPLDAGGERGSLATNAGCCANARWQVRIAIGMHGSSKGHSCGPRTPLLRTLRLEAQGKFLAIRVARRWRARQRRLRRESVPAPQAPPCTLTKPRRWVKLLGDGMAHVACTPALAWRLDSCVNRVRWPPRWR